MRWMVLLIGIVWMAAHVVAPRHLAAINQIQATHRVKRRHTGAGEIDVIGAEEVTFLG